MADHQIDRLPVELVAMLDAVHAGADGKLGGGRRAGMGADLDSLGVRHLGHGPDLVRRHLGLVHPLSLARDTARDQDLDPIRPELEVAPGGRSERVGAVDLLVAVHVDRVLPAPGPVAPGHFQRGAAHDHPRADQGALVERLLQRDVDEVRLTDRSQPREALREGIHAVSRGAECPLRL